MLLLKISVEDQRKDNGTGFCKCSLIFLTHRFIFQKESVMNCGQIAVGQECHICILAEGFSEEMPDELD